MDLGAILASKNEPRRSKIDVENASKFDRFLKASWKAIFSAKNAKGAPQMVNMRWARRNVQLPGEGLGEGSRRLMSRTWLWKIGFGRTPEAEEDLAAGSSARRPRLGGGLKTPLGEVSPPHIFGARALCGLLGVCQDCAVKSSVFWGCG